MSNEIIKPEPIENTARGLTLRTFDDVWKFATAVHRSEMVKQTFTSVEQIVIALQTGLEVGLPPMQALQSLCVINGRATIWGDALPALVWASGLCEGIDETTEGDGDGLTAVCTARRKGVRAPIVGRYSVADAKTAKLWGKVSQSGKPTPWVTSPLRMLKTRARAFALRDGFADVLRGLQCREEVIDYSDAATPVAPQERRRRLADELAEPEHVEEVIEADIDQTEQLSSDALQFAERIATCNSGGDAAKLAVELGQALTAGTITQNEADALSAQLRAAME